jgi:Cation transporting ATPase, C-terminus
MQNAMGIIVAVHVPIAGPALQLALLPLVTSLPILFGPVHVAFLEMIIDPVCTLVYEAESEEGDIMARPPRAPDVPLSSRYLAAWSVAQGAFVLLLVAGIYIGAYALACLRPKHGQLSSFQWCFRRSDWSSETGPSVYRRLSQSLGQTARCCGSCWPWQVCLH